MTLRCVSGCEHSCFQSCGNRSVPLQPVSISSKISDAWVATVITDHNPEQQNLRHLSLFMAEQTVVPLTHGVATGSRCERSNPEKTTQWEICLKSCQKQRGAVFICCYSEYYGKSATRPLWCTLCADWAAPTTWPGNSGRRGLGRRKKGEEINKMKTSVFIRQKPQRWWIHCRRFVARRVS